MNLNEAELAVAKILAQLEADTGSLVDAVNLKMVEVTNMMDKRQRFAMMVIIDLKRLPAHDWGQVKE